jgi:beta-xylosidase
MIKTILIFLIIYYPLMSQVWIPDLGDGTYKNPIIFADYSDPDVVRIGDDFYMTSSSFNCLPALPVLHSKDLVNWELINHAVKKFDDPLFDIPQHGNGVWAPSIRYHNNEFYIYWGDPDRGIFMVKTDDPYSDWEDPVLVKKAYGNIDPCPLWDDDGKVYLVHAFAHSRAGVKSLLQINELSADGTHIIDKGRIVFDGHDSYPTIEGPKIYKKNGYYYIFAPAGGVPTGWQTVLRSKNIYGPYEDNIVLEQGSTKINGPHQGGWVELANGENWFIHFQDKNAYGRIVHLNPVFWENDWPLMGEDYDGNGIGEPVTKYRKPEVNKTYPIKIPQTTDEFSDTKLGLQWQWQANYSDQWYSLSENPDNIRLYAIKKSTSFNNLFMIPNMLLQKFPAETFTVITKMKPHLNQKGEQAGLIVMGLDYACIRILNQEDKYLLEYATCMGAEDNNEEKIVSEVLINQEEIYLQVKIESGALCHFRYSANGSDFIDIGKVFKAREGKWIGAKIGLYCITPNNSRDQDYIDVDWFRFTK